MGMFSSPPGVGFNDQRYSPLSGNASRVPQALFTSYEGLDSGWSDWYGNGTVAHDSSDFEEGTASIKIIGLTDSSLAGMRKDITDVDWSTKAFRILVKSSDWDKVSQADILISTGVTSFDNFFGCNLKSKLANRVAGEWQEIYLTRADFVVGAGTPNWALANDMILRVIGVGGQAPVVWYDGFGAYTEHSTPYVTVSFDDGWVDGYTEGKKKLDQYGYKGTAFVISELLGGAGFMTETQVKTLARQGWDIGGHGQVNLTLLSQQARLSDLRKQKKWLIDRGFKGSDLYAYPNGGYNQAVIADLQKYFSVGRTIDANTITGSGFAPMLVPAFTVSKDTSTGTLQTLIDNAVSSKQWLIITFHKIVASPVADTEYSITNYGTVIDYLATNNINVLPASEVLRRL